MRRKSFDAMRPLDKKAGWSEADLPVRQRTQTGIPIHLGKRRD